MAAVSAEVFISLETSLTLRLFSTFRTLLEELVPAIDQAITSEEWDKAVDMVHQINLGAVYDLNEEYIRYVSFIAMLFGASRLSGGAPAVTAVGLGFENDIVDQVMQSFRQMIVANGEDAIKRGALQLIAYKQNPPDPEVGGYLGTVLKFHNVGFNEALHPRAPAGKPIGGEFIPRGTTTPTQPAQSPPAVPMAVQMPKGVPEYGTAREGSTSVVGVHYGHHAHDYLLSTHHGQGLKDAADERLVGPDVDPRLKQRLYFYVDEGHGIHPEDGVGGVKHTAILHNLYDPQMDYGQLWSKGKGDLNASEKAVLDAGYNGYYVRNVAYQSGVAVLLGDHIVKAKVESTTKADISDADLEAAGLKTPDGNKRRRRKPQDPAKVLTWIALKFNKSHEPAGSAKGGQFAKGAASVTATKEFKAWFKGSKVVDANGNPRVMYHGTTENFDTFTSHKATDVGFHFGTEKAAQDRLAVDSKKNKLKDNAIMMPVYLNIKNPLRVDDQADQWAALPSEIRYQHPHLITTKQFEDWQAETKPVFGVSQAGRATVKLLKSLGYDGLVYKNGVEDKGHDSYVAFDPSQIKSAIGNNGKFSPFENSILKAEEDAPSVLSFDSFVNEAGRAFFNMASSLHTSRLSAFGFTAEADYLGITTYQIDEQLDGRTCPVCEYMNGKTFDVSDARGFLDVVVRTQDPNELRMLQPWPSQSKAGMETIKGMEPDELVMSGWHVPPFHPRCRGLLSKAEGTAPIASPTSESQQQVPEGKYLASQIDFNQLGVHLSPARIEKWNQTMGSDPASVVAQLQGKSAQEILSVAMGMEGQDSEEVRKALGINTLTVNAKGTVNIELQRSLLLAGGDEAQAVADLYFKRERNLFVGSIELSGSQYDNLYMGLREVLMDVYGTAQAVGMDSISMIAGSDMGGYALAKYGLATEAGPAWEGLKAQIQRVLNKTNIFESLEPEEQALLNSVMESDDPRDVFALADMPQVGEALLAGTQWVGYLDLQDPESIARFLSYIASTE